ncbi:MAG TPA: response regulator, partial [Nannocystis sp.]
VAREVGIEGKLGGQAKVPGAAGTWRDLTDNVNQLAANLTTQVRAISDVATAVIQGDLSRAISVEARGEVQALKDTINQMITNLRDTTRTNKEQDWLKTNLARFFGLMQGQRSLESLARLVMSELTPVVGAQHGAMYLMEHAGGKPTLRLVSSYAFIRRKHLASRFILGEGLVGQCALERKPILVTEVPDDYIQVSSGLGEASPRNVAVFPVLFEEEVRGVIELASFHEFAPIQLTFIEQLMLNIGLQINLIGTSVRTEELLQQLQGSNQELERRRKELEEKAQLLEMRNREIAEAGVSLESKARELAKVSRYKSQFLANMSHEIRTPLNSMMILAQMLAADDEGTLTPKQREYAETIHSSGRDLLVLINQILDLSKVEAGRIETHYEVLSLQDVADFAERTFRPVALQRELEFNIVIADDAPESIITDRHLLEQILKNLLSNAFKFTEQGRVELRIGLPAPGTVYRNEKLRDASGVIAFAVADTGIGIASDKHRLVFEAFQQADPTILRKYGGTGLGLTISREYARVLGGEIQLESATRRGSTFTLLLPMRAPAAAREPLELAAAETALEVEGGEEETRESSLTGRTILVVDDDARNLYAVVGLLERSGAKVLAASSAREALATLTEHPDVDLVLMDITMPDVDGLQATREIRAMEGMASLPIVALTAKASESDRMSCLAAGCNDYVVKPVEIKQLLSVVTRNLRPTAR